MMNRFGRAPVMLDSYKGEVYLIIIGDIELRVPEETPCNNLTSRKRR